LKDVKLILHSAPECSVKPAVLKLIFSCQYKATKGSSCSGVEKKVLKRGFVAKSWMRHKLIDDG
jgi:hypothetical protein